MDFSAWHGAEVEFNFKQVHEIERKAIAGKATREVY